MRSKSAVLGVALLILSASAASAGSNYVGLTGGAGIPTGDYSNVASTGWQIGATGTHFVNDMWGFGGDLAYHNWGGSKDANALAEAFGGPGSKISFSAIQATAHATMMFQNSGTVRPYAQFGTGLYSITEKDDMANAGNSSTSKSKLGFNIGAGMNIPSSSNMQWGVAGSYHIVPNDSADIDFMQVGVNVQWGVGSK